MAAAWLGKVGGMIGSESRSHNLVKTDPKCKQVDTGGAVKIQQTQARVQTSGARGFESRSHNLVKTDTKCKQADIADI